MSATLGLSRISGVVFKSLKRRLLIALWPPRRLTFAPATLWCFSNNTFMPTGSYCLSASCCYSSHMLKPTSSYCLSTWCCYNIHMCELPTSSLYYMCAPTSHCPSTPCRYLNHVDNSSCSYCLSPPSCYIGHWPFEMCWIACVIWFDDGNHMACSWHISSWVSERGLGTM